VSSISSELVEDVAEMPADGLLAQHQQLELCLYLPSGPGIGELVLVVMDVVPLPGRIPPGDPTEQAAAYQAQRKAQPSQRIPAEHAIALIKWWRQLQRYTGRRDALPDIIRAVTSLAADRAATW
jgi:hypothetical protein